MTTYMSEYEDLNTMEISDNFGTDTVSLHTISNISENLALNAQNLQNHMHADIFFTLMMSSPEQLRMLDWKETRRLLGDEDTNLLRQGLQQEE